MYLFFNINEYNHQFISSNIKNIEKKSNIAFKNLSRVADFNANNSDKILKSSSCSNLLKFIYNFIVSLGKKTKSVDSQILSKNQKVQNLLISVQNLILDNISNIKPINKWKPAELDKILTNYVGTENVNECKFYPNKRYGFREGRTKSYAVANCIFILEAHTTPRHGIFTRLYCVPSEKMLSVKNGRYYLTKFLDFRRNHYWNKNAHLQSTNKSIDWIRNK